MESNEQDFSSVRKAEKTINFGIQKEYRNIFLRKSQKNKSRIFKSCIRHKISFYHAFMMEKGLS